MKKENKYNYYNSEDQINFEKLDKFKKYILILKIILNIKIKILSTLIRIKITLIILLKQKKMYQC